MILDIYLKLQYTVTYPIQNLKVAEEKRTEYGRQLRPTTDYTQLHEVLRHTLTALEILEVNVRTLDHVVKYHDTFIEQSPSDCGFDIALRKTLQRLLLYAHMVYSIRCRCFPYRD